METNKNKPQNHQKTLLEWQAPEFMPTPRSKTWYMVAGLVVLSLILYAVLSGNWTMVVVFLLLAGLFIFTDKQEPHEVKMVITDMGIRYKGRFHPYHHINAFWMVYHPPYVRLLYLRLSTGRRYKLLRIELNDQKPQEVRQLLLKEIPEIEGAQEPVSDLLGRLLRFH